MTWNILTYHEHLQNQKTGNFITKNDIIDLKIILNISKSVDEFLEIISRDKYIIERE